MNNKRFASMHDDPSFNEEEFLISKEHCKTLQESKNNKKYKKRELFLSATSFVLAGISGILEMIYYFPNNAKCHSMDYLDQGKSSLNASYFTGVINKSFKFIQCNLDNSTNTNIFSSVISSIGFFGAAICAYGSMRYGQKYQKYQNRMQNASNNLKENYLSMAKALLRIYVTKTSVILTNDFTSKFVITDDMISIQKNTNLEGILIFFFIRTIF